MMVLSFVPSTRDAEPVTIEAADAVRRIVDELEGTQRLLLHGRVNPNQPGDLEAMDELAERWGVSAWKTYTQLGPGGKGYFLSDEVGIALHREGARARRQGDLRAQGIAVRPSSPTSTASARDIGVVAKRFPDVDVHHLSLGIRRRTTARAPYDRDGARDGIDTLITSLHRKRRRAEQPTSTPSWAARGASCMREPGAGGARARASCSSTSARTTCCGARTRSGTDRRRIRSRRSARSRSRRAAREARLSGDHRRAARQGVRPQRNDAVQDHGRRSDASTLERDRIARERLAYREHREPYFLTYGPKTRREFLDLLGWNGGSRA